MGVELTEHPFQGTWWGIRFKRQTGFGVGQLLTYFRVKGVPECNGNLKGLKVDCLSFPSPLMWYLQSKLS